METQVYLIEQMLGEPSPQLAPSLSFKTPFAGLLNFDEINRCHLVSKDNPYCARTETANNNFDVGPLVTRRAPTSARLAFRIIYADDSRSGNLESLIHIKEFVAPDDLAYFDIKDCFYRMNSSLLPQALRDVSLREIHIGTPAGFYPVTPRRGLLASFSMCEWFSNVVINENPYVSACMVDDCFCSKKNLPDAKRWFVERGFEINEKRCKKGLFTKIYTGMLDMWTECSICLARCQYRSISCYDCMVCHECYYETNKKMDVRASQVCSSCNGNVNLYWLFHYLGTDKYHLSSLDTLRIVGATDAALFELKQEAAQLFPKYKNIVCMNCKSKNVTVVDDRNVFKCEDCRKFYCPMCDVFDDCPSTPHVCDCSIGRCPQCHTYIEKTEGCNHITCSVCNCEFDYQSKALVANFYVDSHMLHLKKIPPLKPGATMEDLMTIVAQVPHKHHIYGALRWTKIFG